MNTLERTIEDIGNSMDSITPILEGVEGKIDDLLEGLKAMSTMYVIGDSVGMAQSIEQYVDSIRISTNMIQSLLKTIKTGTTLVDVPKAV